MLESIQFDTNLYRRDALEFAAEKYQQRARVELADSGTHVVAQLEPRTSADDSQALRDEFCTEAFSATARRLRDLSASGSAHQEHRGPVADVPPWGLLSPFTEGSALGLGWVLESLGTVRAGAATLVLRHAQHGIARVAIRRNGGAPLGVAHTDHLDFMLMNGGSGTGATEDSIARTLIGLAHTLRSEGNGGVDGELLAALLPHSEGRGSQAVPASNGAASAPARRVAPRVDAEAGTICFDFDEAGVSRLALYDAVLAFADRCYVFLTRQGSTRIGMQLKPRGALSTDALRVLVRDVTAALNRVARNPPAGSPDRHAGLPSLSRRRVDIEGLLAELDAADPTTVGLGFEAERGPGHENLRILNLRGTGACNSECVFCIEKFNPTHRPMANADTTRQQIVDSAGRYDMLFFASGEPTIHPRLFDYVELGRSVGFSAFGMSSHFRTFSDPRFALKTLQAGFEYFDIALHAADLDSQLDVNPIDDGGQSLYEALKGLAVLFRLADALAIRISITQKIVISRLNVTQLEAIFRATYDRGVRHFILQPVRTAGLAPNLQAKLAISEEEMIPHLNELLRNTQGTGAVVKPYGFSRQNLLAAEHVETEQNRVKNLYGKARAKQPRALPTVEEERPTDGRHWVEVRELPQGRFGFASDGRAPILDHALQRGHDLNFGCRMGSCGMCCARLVEGRVDQHTQIFLSDEQVDAGYVLLCQARPLSDVVVQLCTEDEVDQL